METHKQINYCLFSFSFSYGLFDVFLFVFSSFGIVFLRIFIIFWYFHFYRFVWHFQSVIYLIAFYFYFTFSFFKVLRSLCGAECENEIKCAMGVWSQREIWIRYSGWYVWAYVCKCLVTPARHLMCPIKCVTCKFRFGFVSCLVNHKKLCKFGHFSSSHFGFLCTE